MENKKEILTKLIDHYQYCIDNLPEDNYIDFCWNNKICCGICNCAEIMFDIRIYKCDWVRKYGTI